MNDELHVIPRGDQVEHVAVDSCCCGPNLDPVGRDDGTVGWVYVHHSRDGRELREESAS